MQKVSVNSCTNSKRSTPSIDENFIKIPDPNGEDYEPTESELIDYVEWLGGKMPEDRDLMWIARDALKAPIPPGWKLYQRKNGDGEPFYFTKKTGQSLWDHPLDQHFKDLFAQERPKKAEGGGSAANRPPPAIGRPSGPIPKPLLAASSAPAPLGALKPAARPGALPESRPLLLAPTPHRDLGELQAHNSQRLDEERQSFETRMAEEMRILRAKGEGKRHSFRKSLTKSSRRFAQATAGRWKRCGRQTRRSRTTRSDSKFNWQDYDQRSIRN
jgi:hypothetical protein